MGTVPEFRFDDEAAESGRDLFPPEIADDPWVAYHGTSAIYDSSSKLMESDLGQVLLRQKRSNRLFCDPPGMWLILDRPPQLKNAQAEGVA